MKKLISILLAGILIAGAIPAVGFAAEEDGGGRAQAVCVNLGLIDAGAAGAASMTRAQFVKMIANIYGDDHSAYAGIQYFSDVAPGSADAAAIGKVAAFGFIRGGDDALFRPNDPITQEEAAAILVRVLGYDRVTAPDQYLVQAGNLGLFKGVGNADAGAAQLVTMVYNALEADLMEQNQYGANADFNVSKDKNLMNTVLNVDTYNGIVQAANGVSLMPEKRINNNYVRIGDVQFEVDGKTNLSVNDMIGLSVTAYYKMDSENTLLFCLENKRSSVITVDLDDLITLDADGVTYYDAGGKKCTEKFAGSPSILYNNRYAGSLPQLSHSGWIRLIDNGSGVETMIVKDYHVSVVNAVSVKNMTVTDKFGAPPLVLDQSSEHYSIRTAAGADTGLDTLKEWNVLSVARSEDGDFTEIIVADQPLQGTVDQIADGETVDTYRITIGGGEYALTDEYFKYMKRGHELTLGMEGTFYLDKDGRIAGYNQAAVSSVWKLGYLVKAGMATELSTELQLKILTADGNMMTAPAKLRGGRILVDETLVSPAAFLAANADADRFVRKVIRYKMDNDGKVSELETASEGASGAGLRHIGKFSGLDYFSSSRSFENQIVMSPDTVVFTVPSKKEKYDDDSSYKTNKLSLYSNRNSYSPDVYAYSDGLQGEIIVRAVDLKTELMYSTNLSMVKSFGMSVNLEGDRVQKLFEIKDGKEASVIGTAETDLKHTNYNPSTGKNPGTTGTTYTIEEGDVIRHGSSNGETDFVQMLYDRSEDQYLPNANPIDQNQGQYKVAIGTVVKIDGNLVQFRFRGTDKEEYYLTDKATYAVYDEKEDDHVQVGDVTDIRDLENYPEDPSIVFIHVKYGELTGVMIYN